MSINDWLSDYAYVLSDDPTQAQDTANIIADKTTLITVERPGAGGVPTTVGLFPVRLETLGTVQDEDGGLTVVGRQGIMVLGYRGHPDWPNTTIRRGDTFFVADENQRYAVTQVLVDTRVSFQAIGEATGAQ